MKPLMKGDKCCGGKIKGGTYCGGYFLAFIGALVYYIQTATSFGQGFWGVIKALFWPATLIYELLGFLA
jgi:hypothetical protein